MCFKVVFLTEKWVAGVSGCRRTMTFVIGLYLVGKSGWMRLVRNAVPRQVRNVDGRSVTLLN
jgi:hypothetical protein